MLLLGMSIGLDLGWNTQSPRLVFSALVVVRGHQLDLTGNPSVKGRRILAVFFGAHARSQSKLDLDNCVIDIVGGHGVFGAEHWFTNFST
jgi:hypothetical protein